MVCKVFCCLGNKCNARVAKPPPFIATMEKQSSSSTKYIVAMNQPKEIPLSEESSDDETDWQDVSSNKRRNNKPPEVLQQKHKQQRTDDEPSTSSNRFAALSKDEDKSKKEDTVTRAPQPPPIFIPNVASIEKMVKNLIKILDSKDFNYKSLRDGQVRLSIKSIDSYRKIVKHFEASNIAYHTYQLKQERAFSVVIKGLHHTTPIEDIKACLLSLGHQVRSIRNAKSRVTKEPLSMFFVDLDPDVNNKDIYDIKSIDNAIITIEPPIRSNDLVQCHRCQQFGHTKTYCKKPFNCVKCGMNHATAECTKAKDTPACCVHCLKPHTANYKGCEFYQTLLSKRKMISQTNGHRNQQFSNSNEYYQPSKEYSGMPNQSYGNATYAGTLKGPLNGNNLLEKIESMLAKQIELTNTLINMMSMMMTKLCN